MEKIICPICGSDKTDFYCEKNNFSLYVCGACQSGFIWPLPELTEEIYKENYFKKGKEKKEFGYSDYDADKEPMRIIFEDYLEKAEELTAGRKIFDIGAATGYFLDLAKKRGWETHGSDISRYASETAGKKGHKVIYGDLTDMEIKEKFNVVTLWDVLEHLKDPGEYLKIANNLLESGGILFINTVNIQSTWAKLLGKRWHLIVPPEHLFYFSPKSLKMLLENAGFKILSMKSQGKKFTLAYIFKTLYSWQGLGIWNSLSNFFDKKFFNKFYIPVKLGDNILVIAKRTSDVQLFVAFG